MSSKSNETNEFMPTNSMSNHLINRQNELIIHYLDMGYVASTLEDSIVLSNPFIQHIPGNQREVEQEEYLKSKELVQKYRTKNIKLCKKLDKQVETRELLFSTIREVYPTFCKDIDKKMSAEDYMFYMKQQKKLRQVLVNKQHSFGPEKKASECAIERKDKIAELIDSEDFSKACLIEDKFVVSEFQKYLELLKTATRDEQHSQKKHKIPYKENTNASAEELAKTSIEERHNRILKYKEILELFDKIKSKKYIKLNKIPNTDEENLHI